MTIGLTQAVGGLKALRLASLEDAAMALTDVRNNGRMAQIVSEYAPERWQQARPTSLKRVKSNENTPLEEALLFTLNGLFPTWWSMEEQFINLEYGEAAMIWIEPQGLWESDDNFLGELNFQGEKEPQSYSALYFAKFLDYGIDEEETWLEAGEYFGWPEIRPIYCNQRYAVKELDVEKFETLMEAHGLDDMLLAFQTAWHVTGNTFLDANEDDEIPGGIEMTVANVGLLAREWQAAKGMLERIEGLSEQIRQNQALLGLTLGLWDACFSKIEIRTEPPRTLLEVFENETPRTLVDPFYGPLGVDEGEEEEEA